MVLYKVLLGKSCCLKTNFQMSLKSISRIKISEANYLLLYILVDTKFLMTVLVFREYWTVVFTYFQATMASCLDYLSACPGHFPAYQCTFLYSVIRELSETQPWYNYFAFNPLTASHAYSMNLNVLKWHLSSFITTQLKNTY